MTATTPHSSDRKIALITGASSGIGLELARVFARHGHDLVLVARNRDALEKLSDELKSAHPIEVLVIAKDLSQPQAPGELLAATEAAGWPIEILVNNAGFGDYGLFVEEDWTKLQQMIELNILSLTHMTHLFAKKMVERKSGRILNLASVAAFLPGPLMAVYYATKAYVLHFSEAIHNELADSGVSVTALCPGPTKSGFAKAANSAQSKAFQSRHLPTSADVAQYGYDALMDGDAVAVHGFLNKTLTRLIRFAPRDFTVKTVRYVQRRSESAHVQ